MRKEVIFFLALVLCFQFVSAESISDDFGYTNTGTLDSGFGYNNIDSYVIIFNNNSQNVNNSFYWQGYTPSSYLNNFLNPNLTGSYVPYVGASKNVLLGNNNFSIGESDFFVNNNNDRIGIGTLIPSDRIEIRSLASDDSGYSLRTTTGSARARIAHGTSGAYIDLWDSTGQNTVKIRSYAVSGIQAYFTAGRVGIGTDTPNAPLDVTGSTFPVGSFTRTTSLTGGSFDGLSGIGSGYSLKTISTGNMVDGFGGGIVLSGGDSGTSTDPSQNIFARIYARRDGGDTTGALQFFAGTNNADTPKLTIRGTGNVGIGTTTPQTKLQVNGTTNILSLAGTYTGDSAYVCVYNNGTLFSSESACP